jgi:DNA-binding NarL/FixJ family response regulator
MCTVSAATAPRRRQASQNNMADRLEHLRKQLLQTWARARTVALNAPLPFGMTAGEAAVARAVLRGQTTMAIAAELVVSTHAVPAHLRNVVEKPVVNSRQQLATRLLSAT